MSDHNFCAFVIRFLYLLFHKPQPITKALNPPQESCRLRPDQQKVLERSYRPQSGRLHHIFATHHFFVPDTFEMLALTNLQWLVEKLEQKPNNF